MSANDLLEDTNDTAEITNDCLREQNLMNPSIKISMGDITRNLYTESLEMNEACETWEYF